MDFAVITDFTVDVLWGCQSLRGSLRAVITKLSCSVFSGFQALKGQLKIRRSWGEETYFKSTHPRRCEQAVAENKGFDMSDGKLSLSFRQLGS